MHAHGARHASIINKRWPRPLAQISPRATKCQTVADWLGFIEPLQPGWGHQALDRSRVAFYTHGKTLSLALASSSSCSQRVCVLASKHALRRRKERVCCETSLAFARLGWPRVAAVLQNQDRLRSVTLRSYTFMSFAPSVMSAYSSSCAHGHGIIL